MAAFDKVTADLASILGTVDDEELVDVVVELDRSDGDDAVLGADQATKIAHLKRSFELLAKPLEEWIASLGGEIVGDAWINATIRARVPVQAIPVLAEADSVAVLDVPHRLEPDTG